MKGEFNVAFCVDYVASNDTRGEGMTAGVCVCVEAT